MFLLQRRLLMTTSVAALSAATVAVSDAETLAGSETDALAIVYTDDHFKATTGFNGSVYCLDSGTPANDYDSSPTTEAASYFTYTSPSPKMVLHDDGVLKYAAHNLVLQSEDFSTSWTAQNVTAASSQLTDDGTSGRHAVVQSFAVTSGAMVQATCELSAGTNDYAFVCISDAGSANYTAVIDLTSGTVTETDTSGVTGGANSVVDVGGGYYRLSVRCTAPAATSYVYIGLAPAGTGNTFDASGVVTYSGSGQTISLRKAHLHRYPADTTYLKTTSAARFCDTIEFNSSGTALGLLVEPQRTNLVTYNSQFDNGAWNKSGTLSVNANAQVAPNGLTQADTITATVNTDYISQTITVSASTQYTFSFFFKAGTKASTTVAAYDNSNTSFISTNLTQTTETVGDYTRISCTFTTPSGCTQVSVYPYRGGGSGTTGTFRLWGAQLEAGSSATSPIETFGSTVTRAADDISKATSAFPFQVDPFSFYIKYTPKNVEATSNRVLDFNNVSATNNDRITHHSADILHLRVYNTSSTEIASIDAGSVTVNTETLFAGAVASDDFAASLNGNAAVTDSAGTLDNTITTLYFNSGGTFNGHIEEILILPRRVSNADLQTLTSTGALP